MERVYTYNSSAGMELLSVVISFNLQEHAVSTDIVDSITNIIQSSSNISINLSDELQILAFQPSRKSVIICTLLTKGHP